MARENDQQIGRGVAAFYLFIIIINITIPIVVFFLLLRCVLRVRYKTQFVLI